MSKISLRPSLPYVTRIIENYYGISFHLTKSFDRQRWNKITLTEKTREKLFTLPLQAAGTGVHFWFCPHVEFICSPFGQVNVTSDL